MNRHAAIHLWALLASALMVTSCGGDNPDPVTPTPTRNAASISVVAGSGQTVAAGQVLPVAPAVVVRDAQGNALAGATVVFAVAKGGGAVQGASQVTGADGTARVTSWTLGVSGAQQLTATVGSLTPVLIDATIDPATERISQVVPPVGGVITLATPNHPYEGLTLTVPAGAFPTSVSWSLQVRPDATLPALPAGFRVAAPVLEISTDGGRAGSLMTLDVPVTTQPGESVVLAFYDPSRGAMEVMSTVARTDSSIRVMTTHMRADLLLGPASSAGFRMATRLPTASATPVSGLLIPVAFATTPTPAVPTVLPPSAQWPVLDNGSAAHPDGFGPAIPVLQMLAATKNLNLAGIKTLSTPGFYADAGMLAALNRAMDNNTALFENLLTRLELFYEVSFRTFKYNGGAQDIIATLQLLKAPDLVALFPDATGPTAGNTVFANPVASMSHSLDLLLPTNAGQTTVSLNSQGFDPFNIRPTADASDRVANSVLALGGSMLIDTSPFDQVIAAMTRLSQATVPGERDRLNDSLAAAAGLAKPTIEAEAVPGGGWAPLNDSGPIPVRGDMLNIRALGGADGLSAHLYETGALLQDAAASGYLQLTTQLLGEIEGSLKEVSLAAFKILGNAPFAPPSHRTGSAPTGPLLTNGGALRQLSARRVEFVRAKFAGAPDTVQIAANSTTAAFDAQVAFPPSDGFRIRWEWGDGAVSDNLNLTNASHAYSVIDDYDVIVTLQTADRSVILAVDTVHVQGEPASPHWGLTSIANPDSLGVTALIPITLMLRDAIANPSSAMIAVDSVAGGGTELRLRVLATGSWTKANCCGPASGVPGSGEARETLGVLPSTSVPVGIYFFGTGDSSWSQSSSDLSTGTMAGQAMLGTFSYNVRNQGTQIGPRVLVGMQGTRSGTLMTGTITVVYWPILDVQPFESVRYVDSPEVSVFPFTAVRLR